MGMTAEEQAALTQAIAAGVSGMAGAITLAAGGTPQQATAFSQVGGSLAGIASIYAMPHTGTQQPIAPAGNPTASQPAAANSPKPSTSGLPAVAWVAIIGIPAAGILWGVSKFFR